MVDNISFTIPQEKITALIGESGGGKTQTGLALAGLLPKNSICKIDSVPSLDNFVFSFIFQDPLNALNPIMKIGSQIKEAIKKKKSSSQKKQIVLKLLRELEISGPEKDSTNIPMNFPGE